MNRNYQWIGIINEYLSITPVISVSNNQLVMINIKYKPMRVIINNWWSTNKIAMAKKNPKLNKTNANNNEYLATFNYKLLRIKISVWWSIYNIN